VDATAQTSKGYRAAEAVSAALKELIATRGERAALEVLHPLSRHAVARLTAGMAVRSATLIVAADRLHVNLVGTIADPEPEDEGGDA
jgi:hypothetical protein